MLISVALQTALEPLLVCLRFILAVITAFTALDQFGRLRAQKGPAFRRAFAGASLVLGLSIWVGHFIGLQALSVYNQPGIAFYTNTYAVYPVLLTLAVSIVTAMGTLWISSYGISHALAWLVGGTWLGMGLGLTRDLDNFALFIPLIAELDGLIRAFWFGVVVAFSVIAFGLAHRVGREPGPYSPRRLWAAALLLGGAITAAQFACIAAAVITLPAPGTVAATRTFHVTDLWAVSLVIIGLIGMYFYRDGVERHRRALAAVKAKSNALLEMERLKRDLLGTASHELRTPIAIIIGNTELLEDGVGGTLTLQQQELLSNLQAGTTRLTALVDNMLDFVALEAGTFALACTEDDFRLVVSDTRAELQTSADAAGVTLAMVLPSERLSVRHDPARMQQVLRALVGNAIKFNQPGGKVEVKAMRCGNSIRVVVEDTGIGVAASDLPQLFGSFSQLDHGTTRERGGAGLGLALAKALVEAHGGRIGAESKVGVGSCFWFTLPKEDTVASADPAGS